MPEWFKGADCKSADFCQRWFKSSSAQKVFGKAATSKMQIFLLFDLHFFVVFSFAVFLILNKSEVFLLFKKKRPKTDFEIL